MTKEEKKAAIKKFKKRLLSKKPKKITLEKLKLILS